MKRIIDIDEDYYENLKYNVEQGQKYKPWEIIVNSTPYEERPQVSKFDVEGFKKFVGSRIDMQDLYLPIHFFELLDEYCGADMRGEEE